MHVVIFEGSRWDTFAPLSLSRPTFMLPCGMGRLIDQQIELLKPTRLTLWVRPQLVALLRRHVLPKLPVPTEINQPLDDEPAVLTSGRTLHFARFELPAEPCVVHGEQGVVQYAYVRDMAGLSPTDVFQRSPRWQAVLNLPQDEPQGRFVNRLWDLIAWNEEALIADFVRWKGGNALPAGPWHVVQPADVRIMHNVKLAPGCVLDASRGPIVIDTAASIGAAAVVEGPCYIGAYTQISPQAYIRHGTTIGKVCKVGGEVSNSVINSFSNMPHHGFIGDSFVGSWVNIGAGTVTSNLKNTYGDVRVQIGSHQYQTTRGRLGAMIGDHSKLAIGTRLNTGSYIGYCCQLSGSQLTPKFVPSFSFWTDDGTQPYDLDRAKVVAKRMMDRRDRPWTDVSEEVMNYVAATAADVEG